MVVFTIFLGQLAGVAPDGDAVPAVRLRGARALDVLLATRSPRSANSLVGSSNLVSKIYFPRILLPVAAACSFVLDFAISFVVLLVLMVGYRHRRRRPTAVLLAGLRCCTWSRSRSASGIWLSALNVRYRDVRYAVPFLIQLWLFATPVAYQFDRAGRSTG